MPRPKGKTPGSRFSPTSAKAENDKPRSRGMHTFISYKHNDRSQELETFRKQSGKRRLAQIGKLVYFSNIASAEPNAGGCDYYRANPLALLTGREAKLRAAAEKRRDYWEQHGRWSAESIG